MSKNDFEILEGMAAYIQEPFVKQASVKSEAVISTVVGELIRVAEELESRGSNLSDAAEKVLDEVFDIIK
jgi:hypothetical protein